MPWCAGDERSQLRHNELRHRLEILLSLHHVRELREVGLQPVLLVVLLGRGLQVRDHLVQVVLQLVQLSLSLDRDLPAQITARHSGRDICDRAHLQRQAVRHRVHVVGERSPRSGGAGHFCLATELSFGAYFLGDARYFVREDTERVDHRVDGVLELENLAAHFDGDLLREVSLGDGGRDEGDVSDLARQVSGERIHVVGQILPRACDSGHVRLAAEFSFRAYVARDARHFGRERAQLIDHGVDRVLQLEDLALHIHGHLARQVALRDRGRHVGDVSHLAREVRGHEVHVVGEILPRSRDSRHVRLATQASFGADLARNACDFSSEHAQAVDHCVDRLLQLEDLSLHVRGDLSREISLRDRGGDVSDVSDLTGEARGHRVHVVGEVLPGTADSGHCGLTTQTSFGSDFARNTRHFRRKGAELIDHRVDGVLELRSLSLSLRP